MRGIIDSEHIRRLSILLEKQPEEYAKAIANLEKVLNDLSAIQVRLNKRYNED